MRRILCAFLVMAWLLFTVQAFAAQNGNISNADIARTALGYDGENLGGDGECKRFVQIVVNSLQPGLLGAGYRSAFLAAGQEISESDLQYGDVIQTFNPNSTDDKKFEDVYHTAIFLERTSTPNSYLVVDSNRVPPGHTVAVGTWNPFSHAAQYGHRVHFYRLGVTVGITPSGYDATLTPAFLNAYASYGGANKLGFPFRDNGGPAAVHEWYGVQLQNFKKTTPPYFGTNGESALVFNPTQYRAYLVKEGMWGAYVQRTPANLGYPLGDEYATTTNCQVPYRCVEQKFQYATMRWESAKPMQIVITFNDGQKEAKALQSAAQKNTPAPTSKMAIVSLGQMPASGPSSPYDPIGSPANTAADPPIADGAQACMSMMDLRGGDPAKQKYYNGLVFNGDRRICDYGWDTYSPQRDNGAGYGCTDDLRPNNCFTSVTMNSRENTIYGFHVVTMDDFPVIIQAGKTYRFSMMTRLMPPVTTKNVILALTPRSPYDAHSPPPTSLPTTFHDPVTFTLSGNTWQSFQAVFTARATSDNAALRLYMGDVQADVRIDDIRLEEIAPAASITPEIIVSKNAVGEYTLSAFYGYNPALMGLTDSISAQDPLTVQLVSDAGTVIGETLFDPLGNSFLLPAGVTKANLRVIDHQGIVHRASSTGWRLNGATLVGDYWSWSGVTRQLSTGNYLSQPRANVQKGNAMRRSPAWQTIELNWRFDPDLQGFRSSGLLPHQIATVSVVIDGKGVFDTQPFNPAGNKLNVADKTSTRRAKIVVTDIDGRQYTAYPPAWLRENCDPNDSWFDYSGYVR